jgi:hypothetical protein
VPAKILYNFQVVGALYRTPGGDEAQAGDEIAITLNQATNPAFPASITGLLQNPIKRVSLFSGGCAVEGTSYSISYDSDDLDGAAATLNACDIVAISVTSCCELLRTALDAEIAVRTAADVAATAARIAADAVIQADLNLWDPVILSAEPVDGTAGTAQQETQTAVGTITGTGSLTVTVTSARFVAPVVLSVSVNSGDTATAWAAKVAADMSSNATIALHFNVDNIGADVALTAKVIAANDGTLNVAFAAGTTAGITPDASSNNTTAGVAAVTGTAAARIGQHAIWNNRVWEATTSSPSIWTELTSERNSPFFEEARTGLTGGGVATLDGIVVGLEDVGRMQIIVVGGLTYLYELIVSADVEASPTTIKPDNIGTLAWKLRHAVTRSSAVLDASAGGNGVADSGLVAKFLANGERQATGTSTVVDSATPADYVRVSSLAGVVKVVSKIGAFLGSLIFPTVAAAINWTLPANRSGTISLDALSVPVTPVTGFTVTATAFSDQVHYLTPAGTLANGAFALPTAANSRAGQIVRVHSTEEVTTAVVTVTGGGTINGAAVSSFVADTSYAWQCVSVAGAGTWIRI